MNKLIIRYACILLVLTCPISAVTILSDSMNPNTVLDINENLIDYDFFRSTLSTQHALNDTPAYAGYLSYSDQLHVAFLSNQLIDTIIEFSLLLHIGEAIGIDLGQSALDAAKNQYLKRLDTGNIDHKAHQNGLLNYANLIGKKRYVKQAVLSQLETRMAPSVVQQLITQRPGLSLVNKKVAYEAIKLPSGPIIHQLVRQKKWKKIKKVTRSESTIAMHQVEPKAFHDCPETIQDLLLKMKQKKRPIVYDDGHTIWALSVTEISKNPEKNTQNINQEAAKVYLSNWLKEASQHNSIKINKDYVMGLQPTNSIIQEWLPKIKYFIDSPIAQGSPYA